MGNFSSNLQHDARAILKREGELLDRYLSQLRTRSPGAPTKLLDAMDYSLTAGGKRLRPTLILQCYRACQCPPLQGRGNSTSLPSFVRLSSPLPLKGQASADDIGPSPLACALAMELIHTFSLVHDDLPAMDDDDLRRGRPTNHKVFGEALAILAGDAMVTLAFQILATDTDPDLAPTLITELATASGPAGMIGGQVLDIESENQNVNLEKLQQIHRLKTGALLTCSCRLGAICARATPEILTAITHFGNHLGLAFQIIDDVLDVTSTPEQLGKQTNKDSDHGKSTYPGLLGLDAARTAAADELTAALTALKPLGDRAAPLITLAKFVVERQN